MDFVTGTEDWGSDENRRKRGQKARDYWKDKKVQEINWDKFTDCQKKCLKKTIWGEPGGTGEGTTFVLGKGVKGAMERGKRKGQITSFVKKGGKIVGRLGAISSFLSAHTYLDCVSRCPCTDTVPYDATF